MRQQVNEELDRYRYRLERASTIDPEVRRATVERLAFCDQYTPGTRITGGETPDPVLRWVNARSRILNQYELYLWAISQVGEAIDEMERYRRALEGERPPAPECRDGGFGKDLSPDLAASIATCMEIPHKVGLCARHYMAWYRERGAA